jgi:hypothetical protein
MCFGHRYSAPFTVIPLARPGMTMNSNDSKPPRAAWAVFVWEHAMPAPHPPEVRDRARDLVTTTTRPLTDIAEALHIGLSTVRAWMADEGWTRPGPKQGVTKVPKRRYAALQRIWESRARVTDIAVVAGCSSGRLAHIAAEQGWAPRPASPAQALPADKPVSAAIAAIQAALRDPALTRADLVRQLERTIALAAADALGGDRDAERNTRTLAQLAALVRNLPEEIAAPLACKDIHAPDPVDHFPEANDLIEEIARRFEEFGNDLLHPRVLAAIAETTP